MAMRAANPAFIPRNHLVEEAISAAVNDGDFLHRERHEVQPAADRLVHRAQVRLRIHVAAL